MNDRTDYNREQKRRRREALELEQIAVRVADIVKAGIADIFADMGLPELIHKLSAVGVREADTGSKLSAVGTHSAPKEPRVSEWPTAIADADRVQTPVDNGARTRTPTHPTFTAVPRLVERCRGCGHLLVNCQCDDTATPPPPRPDLQ